MLINRDSITLRRTAEQLAEQAEETDGILDFTDVEFVSRAATDEFLAHEITKDSDLQIDDAHENVQIMFEKVRESRVTHNSN